MKIISVSDVITNSSSEVFMINYPGMSASLIAAILTELHFAWLDNGEDNYGGMGGEINFYDWTQLYCARYNESPLTVEEWLKERNMTAEEATQLLWVELDWSSDATIDYITTKFNAIDDEYTMLGHITNKEVLEEIKKSNIPYLKDYENN